MEYTTLFTGVIILLSAIVFIQRKRRKYKLPPGPKGYPLLGNTLQLDFNNIHLKLEEWANKYGDIYHVNIFGRDTVVLNTGDINREAFLQEPNATNLADRIPGMVGKDFFCNFHDIGFACQSIETIRRRKLGYRLMKAYGEGIAVIEKCFHDELDGIIRCIDQKGKSPIDVENIVDNFIYGAVITLLTGRRYDVHSEMISTVSDFNRQLTLMMDPEYDFLLHWFPLFKKIPCKVAAEYKKGKSAQEKFFKLLVKHLENHPNDKGVLHALYEAKRTEIDKNGQLWLTEEDVFGIVTNIVSAAVLTSKGTLLSLIRCLLSWPDIQEKLQREVDHFVESDRKPKLNDRKSMPYTEAVILETLRLISHLPVSVPHGTMNDTKLRGYDIPKGTTIISNLWKVHHNEKVYESPYKFNPERFLDTTSGELLPYESTEMRNAMAFGLGKRACIGEAFAKGRLFVFVSTIMQNYTLVPDDANPLPPFHPSELLPGLVRMPPGYSCKFEKRVPKY